MFKLTGTSGRRNAGTGGVAQAAGRIVSPFNRFRSGPAPGLRNPAFTPDTPQEHAFDTSSPRLSGLEDRIPST
jgi:hypothetical protein